MWPKGRVPRSYARHRAFDGALTPALLWLPCDLCGVSVNVAELDPKATEVTCLTHRHGRALTGNVPAAYCERCVRRAQYPEKPRIATGVYAVSGVAFGRPWTKLLSLCGTCGMEAHSWTYFAPCPECKDGAEPGDVAQMRHLRSGACAPIVGRYVTSVELRASGSEIAAAWLKVRGAK